MQERLERQVKEMESFLDDYGLRWAGFRASDNNEEVLMTSVDPSKTTEQTLAEKNEIYFDVAKFRTSINELNGVAGEGNALWLKEQT